MLKWNKTSSVRGINKILRGIDFVDLKSRLQLIGMDLQETPQEKV
jgi:hypothetical protein